MAKGKKKMEELKKLQEELKQWEDEKQAGRAGGNGYQETIDKLRSDIAHLQRELGILD